MPGRIPVALSLLHCGPHLKTFAEAMDEEGKSAPQVKVCLKRYSARQRYRERYNPRVPLDNPSKRVPVRRRTNQRP
jgi:hypothetical protein